LDPGGFADNEHEKPGGNGVEGAAVTDLSLIKATANEVDNVVGSSAGRFVDQEETVQLRDHKGGGAFVYGYDYVYGNN
jgi:hypothetical protein